MEISIKSKVVGDSTLYTIDKDGTIVYQELFKNKRDNESLELCDRESLADNVDRIIRKILEV